MEKKKTVVQGYMAEILIASAAVSNYEGMDALVGQDGRVYLGRQENYFPSIEDSVPAYYDNSDNSLQLVSDNVRIFHLLYGEGWPLSQRQMRRERCFTNVFFLLWGYTTIAPMQKCAGTTVALGHFVSKSLRDNLDFAGRMAGVYWGRLDNQNRAAPVGPGHIAQKSRPIFKDDFLRNVIISICFLAFSSKILRFRVPNKS